MFFFIILQKIVFTFQVTAKSVKINAWQNKKHLQRPQLDLMLDVLDDATEIKEAHSHTPLLANTVTVLSRATRGGQCAVECLSNLREKPFSVAAERRKYVSICRGNLVSRQSFSQSDGLACSSLDSMGIYRNVPARTECVATTSRLKMRQNTTLQSVNGVKFNSGAVWRNRGGHSSASPLL